MNFDGANRRKVRTFQGELRQKDAEKDLCRAYGFEFLMATNSAVEKARNILENSEGIQPITVSFFGFLEKRDFFPFYHGLFRSRQM